MFDPLSFFGWLLGNRPQSRRRLRVPLQVEQLEDRYAPAAPVGVVDVVTSSGRVSGWAYDADTPSRSIQIHVYLDGRISTSGIANTPRADVNAKFHINGQHGYSIPLPEIPVDGHTHSIKVYALDSTKPSTASSKLLGSKSFIGKTSFRGIFDGITPDGIARGWVFDRGSTSQSVPIQFYVDGQLALERFADESRPDVNRAYHISGKHGFTIQLPDAVFDGRSHTITIYAGDPTSIPRPLVGTRSFSYGDAMITGPTPDGPIQLRTGARYAGAFYSLIWKGKEFLDSADHGRGLQSCVFTMAINGFRMSSLGYNPTEAGSMGDGVKSTSSSRLRAFKASGNHLEAKTQMAFWLPPGFPNAVNQTTLSNFFLTKDVTIGFKGLPNVIRYRTTFYIPPNDKTTDLYFETLCAYLPPEFSTFKVYDPNTEMDTDYDPGFGETAEPLPPIISTSDESYAIGLVAERTRATVQGQLEYRLINGSQRYGVDVNKFSTMTRMRGPALGGEYTFVNYLIIGDLQTVVSTMQKLQTLITLA